MTPEEACNQAETWADTMQSFGSSAKDTKACADATALEEMLRALARAVRMGIVAESPSEEISLLIEEIEGGIKQAQQIAFGIPICDEMPNSARETVPPPSKYGRMIAELDEPDDGLPAVSKK